MRAAIIALVVCLAVATHVRAQVANWKFEANQNGNDVMGNFAGFVLNGNANFEPEGLRVRGSGTSATGWARAHTYSGPTINSRTTGYTLASCATLKSFSVKAGSLVTIDRTSSDHFDGIIFAERQTQRWMLGSSGFQRTTDFVPGFQETTPDERLFVAITSAADGNTDRITGYRGTVNIGSYTDNTIHSWSAGDAESFFGLRHGHAGGGPGALDAVIHESWIFDRALTAQELTNMANACVVPPTPVPPTPAPTQDPAVAAFCDDVAAKCTSMAGECTTIRNGQGPVIGSGSMSHQAGNGGVGEQTGGVTLSGNSVVVTATGVLSCGTNCPTTGPNGEGVPASSNMVLPGVNRHSLLARIGAGPWQFIGAGPTTLTGTGALTFAFNDGNFPDNTGSWAITIRDDITNVADDCDSSVAACNDVEADCRDKALNCPLV